MSRLLIVGWDGVGSLVLDPARLARLPNLRRIVASGSSGVLRSTIPPITVPAWTAMLTGCDPGQLGLYGFRNRHSFAYDDFRHDWSTDVLHPRVWDIVTAAGASSIVVGVPQTYPPPAIDGWLVSGLEAEGLARGLDGATWPPSLAEELASIAPGYAFDVASYRLKDPAAIIAEARGMARSRARVMRHLLKTRDWRFAMLCEIAPDRLHHTLWSHQDSRHPRFQPGSPYAEAIADFYRLLDAELGALERLCGEDTAILVASDHGAKAMHGAVHVNELLRREGFLQLRREPSEVEPFSVDLVDWQRTSAWAEGGYYARIFLNIRDREPLGRVACDEVEETLARLSALFEELPLSDGRKLACQVLRPHEIYREVRGFPPDLMVFFDDLHWRAEAAVGGASICSSGQAVGLDEANHSFDGFYAFKPAIVGASPGHKDRSITDVAELALRVLGLSAATASPAKGRRSVPALTGVAL